MGVRFSRSASRCVYVRLRGSFLPIHPSIHPSIHSTPPLSLPLSMPPSLHEISSIDRRAEQQRFCIDCCGEEHGRSGEEEESKAEVSGDERLCLGRKLTVIAMANIIPKNIHSLGLENERLSLHEVACFNPGCCCCCCCSPSPAFRPPEPLLLSRSGLLVDGCVSSPSCMLAMNYRPDEWLVVYPFLSSIRRE